MKQKTKNVHKTISVGTVAKRSISRGAKLFIGTLRTALHKFLVFAWPVTEMYSSYKRQRILHYAGMGHKPPTICRLLLEEGL